MTSVRRVRSYLAQVLQARQLETYHTVLSRLPYAATAIRLLRKYDGVVSVSPPDLSYPPKR